MIIGCVKEIKSFENRVSLLPSQVKKLSEYGAKVLIEKGAGLKSNITDEMYRKNGALIVDDAKSIWQEAKVIVKVKEPLKEEFQYFRPGLTLFTFLHLAAEKELCENLLKSKVTSIAYETIEENGEIPILKPMSEVAGRMSVQVGAFCLEKQNGGKGLLLGGVPGVRKGRVLIIGAGVVGKNAAKMALGLSAEVSIMDVNTKKLEEMDDLFQGKVKTVFSNEYTIKRELLRSDLVIGAVLILGAKAPLLVTKDMVRSMEEGSVIVDVAVDQGGCIETSRKTTHDKPTYIEEGIVHYGVANMPGAVSQTSSLALCYAQSPYLFSIAQNGVFDALKKNKALLLGLNTFDGMCTHKAVAESLNLTYQDAKGIFLKS